MSTQETPGETLYGFLVTEDYHNNDHKEWQDISAGERRMWEGAAQKVLNEHCVTTQEDAEE